MKKFIIIILSFVTILSICFVAFLTSPVQVELIGIGGGGAFFNPMIDPTDSDIYYVTSDMGGLYYSYNKGKTWKRSVARGVFTDTHITNNGTVFAGGYGVYATFDKGKTLELIYPKNVKHSVSRCGWNENLMLADNFNNGYTKCITSNDNSVFFATIDWEGSLNIFSSDYNGDNLKVLYTKKLDITNPVNDIDMYMQVYDNGLYVSMGTKICFYNFEANEMKDIYTAKGYIKAISIIEDYVFFIDDTTDKSLILYTNNFTDFADLLDYNNLDNSFTKYERNGTFNWHFNAIVGNNFNNIFLLFSSPVNEFEDTVDGVLKFNGTTFEWVFDSMFKTRHVTALNGWSYGCHGPFYGICANPKNNNNCLVANIETVYDISYQNEETKQIKTLHCIENSDNTYSTNGLNVQTTYSVKEDPFNMNHIIICTTDLGLQNSFDGGKTWQRMEITGTDYDIYNTCYDLYFDKYKKDVVYAVWSSRHDAPYAPSATDFGHTKGKFAISTDGGKTWNFEYSTGIPTDSIPVKMSVSQTENSLVFAVATFNRGFYLSSDGGKSFICINNGMEQIENLIFGEDVVLTEEYIYCLTAPYISNNGWLPAQLYEYNIESSKLNKIDLGDITLARSLTYSKNQGLFINVIPTYKYHWFEEYNNGSWVNENGGIYKYSNNNLELVFENNDGIFYSSFSNDGKLYATDTYGKVFVIDEGKAELFISGLFTMLKNISFSNNGKFIYITTFGGGTYKISL